jgi:hypothetical protein
MQHRDGQSALRCDRRRRSPACRSGRLSGGENTLLNRRTETFSVEFFALAYRRELLGVLRSAVNLRPSRFLGSATL